MGRATLAPLLLGLLLSGGCATSAPFVCPARGGPPWRDLGSEHFVLRTNLDEPAALALLRRLEGLRSVVVSVLFDEPPESRASVEVVAFRSETEFRFFAPPDVDAYYLRSAGGPPRIVLTGTLERRQRVMLAHELTHHYLATVFARQPRWFSEGMATLVEAVGDQDDAPEMVVGQAPQARLARIRSSDSRVPVRELLAWDGRTGQGRPGLDWYSSSWLLTHFLVYREPAGFARFQERLVRGEPPDLAWTGAFPEWDPARPRALEGLDATLGVYANHEIQTHSRLVRQGWHGEPVVRLTAPAEVHALRLVLWNHGSHQADQLLRAEIDEAIDEDPDHPLALQQLAALTGQDPLPMARRSVAGHPDDPRAWTFLAGALQGDSRAAEREQAYRNAARLADQNAAALHNLAVELMSQGRSGEALPFAREAARLAPWSPPVLAGQAAVLADLGSCQQAIAVQSRALDVLPDSGAEEVRGRLLAELRVYRLQCRSAPPAAPAAPAPSPAAPPLPAAQHP